MKIQNVVIAGGGVLGSQIAYQCAYAGFHVTTYLRSEASVERARPKVARLHGIYTAELQAAKTGATPVSRGLVMNQDPVGADFDKLLQKADAAYEGFHYETDLAAAVADADLVIEALAEPARGQGSLFQPAEPPAAGENHHCHQFLHSAAQPSGGVHRPPCKVSCPALCQ